jgi:hypothetical protein
MDGFEAFIVMRLKGPSRVEHLITKRPILIGPHDGWSLERPGPCRDGAEQAD